MNILIISPAYAPFGGVGSARMISLSKYLIKRGESVTVLCNDRTSWDAKTLVETIPDKVIVKEIKVPVNEKDASQIYFFELNQMLKKNTYDLLLFSVGAFYPMFYVNKLYKIHHFKYILEYRDAWLFYYSSSATSCKILRELKWIVTDVFNIPKELKTLKNAKKIIHVTKDLAIQMKTTYPFLKKKIGVIENGYSDYILNHEHENQFDSDLTIGLAGKFAAYNYPIAQQFLLAVKDLNNEGINIKIVHIGDRENLVSDFIKNNNMDKSFLETSQVDYNSCMTILNQCDVLLINYYAKKGLGTKIFDYISLDKPILACVFQKSEIANYLKSFKNAYICNTKEKIKDTLKHIYENNIITLGGCDLKQFSREDRNNEYYKIILEIVSEETTNEK